jgi:hypothetical protein
LRRGTKITIICLTSPGLRYSKSFFR